MMIQNKVRLFTILLWILNVQVFAIQDSIQIKIIQPISKVQKVMQFEKLELGIELPAFYFDKVNRFINSKSPVLFNDKYLDLINPFDPKQIDIQFDFWKPDGTSRVEHFKRFGFYYSAFSHQSGKVISSGTAYNLRGRFTPKELGKWKCNAIVIFGKDTLKSNTLNFECVTNSDSKKGFLSISENKKYFKVKDSSFFPVGQNIPWPGDIWYNSKATLPHREYEQYHRLIKQFATGGGNYFRMLITPWTYDIEFETLGNYSHRMSNAWELDQLINFSEEEDLKIHFNMLLHGVLENPSVYTITNWDWPAYDSPVYGDKTCVDPEDKGFCYGRELALASPIEFFTSEEAKRFYKNKLRYIIARWGYSTSIGVLELLSEVNNLGQQGNLQNNGNGCPNIGTVTSPYRDSSNVVPKIVLGWQNEMAKYIKEELEHDNHPIAVSYTGQPDIKNGDLSYYSPYIDIATYNAYSFDKKQNKYARLLEELISYRKTKLQISNSILRKEDSRRSVGIDKPFMLSEIGSGMTACDDNVIWKQSIFLSPFTGLSGVAMPWLNYNNNQDLWRYFGFVNQFMNAIDLSKGKWTSDYKASKSKKVELYHLVSEEREVIGVINNKTYNYFTMKENCKACFCSKDSVVSYLRELENIKSDQKENQLSLKKMGSFKKYNASFYNPLTGIEISSSNEIKSSLFGQLIIPYPELLKKERPFVYFKLETD